MCVAAASLCAVGCGRQRSATAPFVRLRVGVGVPAKGVQGSGARNLFDALSTETWLAARADGLPSERTATDWTWDAPHTTLRLRLRRNVVFHDGTQLTPEIAAKILRSAPTFPALSFEDVTAITPVGTDAVDIRLSRPDAFLLPDLTTLTVVRPGVSGDGTGPFERVKSGGSQTIFRSFRNYYRGRPALDEIDVSTYPTQRGAWAALMRGDIDMLHEVSRQATEFVSAETTVNSYSFARPYDIALVFNVRHPTLRSPEVRKALNEALDRTTLVQQGLNGWGRPADGPIPPEHWAYSPGMPFSFNPDKARQRLDAAGFRLKQTAASSVPARFSFTCLVFADDSRFERLALLVQKQFADIGVEMKLLPLKQQDLESRLLSGDFDAFLFEMAGRTLTWTYEFWHSQQSRHLMNSGYRSADAVLDHLRAASTDDEVRAATRDLARVMHDDPPAAFLAWQTTTRAVSTRFDVQPEKDRDILANIWQWRLASLDQQAIQ